MRTLSYTELPRTNDPRQVFTVDVTVDSAALHARVELRYRKGTKNNDLWICASINSHTGKGWKQLGRTGFRADLLWLSGNRSGSLYW